MTDLAEPKMEEPVQRQQRRAPNASRTVVIVLAEVVVIVALLVLWSTLRGRKRNGRPTTAD